MGKSARMTLTSRSRPTDSVMSCSRSGGLVGGPPACGGEALVALGVEFVCQFGATRLDDSSADEHVHELRMDVTQDAGVVGDEEQPAVHLVGVAVHARADHPQS